MKLKIVGAVLAICVAVAVVGGGLHFVETNIIEKSDDEGGIYGDEDETGLSLIMGENDDYYHTDDVIETYLLMGTDASAMDDKEHNPLADFLLLLVVNKTENYYQFLQIDRNTMADVPLIEGDEDPEEVTTLEEQICTAHWYGKDYTAGSKNTVMAVRNLCCDLPINGYYALSMEEIPKLNSLVGGVEVTVEDDMSSEDKALIPGNTVVLSDKQAEIYLRARRDMEDPSNVKRMARHKQYMTGFMEKMKEKVKADPNCVNDFLADFEDVADTDLNMNDMSKLATEMLDAENRGIISFEGEVTYGPFPGEKKKYEQFFVDDQSKIDVLSELFNLEKEEEVFTEEELQELEEDDEFEEDEDWSTEDGEYEEYESDSDGNLEITF